MKLFVNNYKLKVINFHECNQWNLIKNGNDKSLTKTTVQNISIIVVCLYKGIGADS